MAWTRLEEEDLRFIPNRAWGPGGSHVGLGTRAPRSAQVLLLMENPSNMLLDLTSGFLVANSDALVTSSF